VRKKKVVGRRKKEGEGKREGNEPDLSPLSEGFRNLLN
jgi:hypothetical protein